MKLITQHVPAGHVSQDTVSEFERTILSDPDVHIEPPYGAGVKKASYTLWRLQKKMGLNFPLALRAGQGRSDREDRSFAVLMGPDFIKCLPSFYRSGVKGVYMFDAWPRHHGVIADFLDTFRVGHAFFSSSQAAQRMSALTKGTRCLWVPEGIDASEYRWLPPDKKNIDVLALGRRYNAYHERIVRILEREERTYLYEKTRGNIIFPAREGFLDGLARAKVSVCVPSSITDPDRAEGIETMTVRYLQSMASKCLIVGHAPEEMIRLFGYNPVIEIRPDDPGEQLLGILRSYGDHLPLIERNYALVREMHTWQRRWMEIVQRMAEERAPQQHAKNGPADLPVT